MYGYESPQAKREKSLYINLFCDLAKCNFKDVHGHKMLSAPEEVILMYMAQAKEQPIYRIQINNDNTVQTTCYDLLDAFNPELKNYYETLDELPNWVQDKLAVLMLLDHTKVNEEVKGVGRRISKDVYWVFNGETDGNNPRREG
jgi:hypothetical protein